MSLNPTKPVVLPGGMRAAVLQMSRQDMVHDASFSEALGSVIEHEAKAHHAAFQAAQFTKVIDAVKEGKISAYFILAGWDACRMKVAGASIEFPTVVTEWDKESGKFNHYPAIYGEDTCLLSSRLKTLIQERPAGKSLPQGLGVYFEQERIKRWITNKYGDSPLGKTARGRVGEFSAHSSAMIKLVTSLNGTLGAEADGAVLEVDGLTRAMKDKWKLPVEIKDIPYGNGSYPNILLAQWSGEGGKQQIVASFTNGISTFTGDPVTRVQITSNGNLPNPIMLQNVLASLLDAGQDVIHARQWGTPKEAKLQQSPAIPLLGSSQEIYAALMAESQKEILNPSIAAAKPPHVWNSKPSLMRIHALKEPEINAALKAMDAQTRILGTHPMLPGVIDFKNMPQESLCFDIVPAKPVSLNRGREAVNSPAFTLAA
jgi:hypothetical protein